ncbi:cytidine deaminase [Salibacteraceae bacterium]|jgi:cytidine deaminase|nr:cytidine deaminase [Bacteroidota bacterium]MDB0058546.1 cytidine deaminase [Salibacteraceae bacterium]MDB9725314.1 cytidine deaminase [Salibacteraceae bacterium]MDC1204709.1 cytidine deaminase [Salibacteraceae bacterium]
MKKQVIECEFEEYSNASELSDIDKALFLEAKRISQNAYAPYSGFNVGAAVRLENGKVILGTNQENIAYPSGLCAERVALFSAHSLYPKQKIESVAIYAYSKNFIVDEVVSPCGACRQVIAEYEEISKQAISVIMGSDAGVIKTNGVKQLLPFRFSSKGLKS